MPQIANATNAAWLGIRDSWHSHFIRSIRIIFMLDYLEHLRKKPLHYRKRVLLFTTGCLTGAILIIWISTLHFDNPSAAIDSAAADKAFGPIEEVKTSIVSLYGSTKEVLQAVGASFFGTDATSSPQ